MPSAAFLEVSDQEASVELWQSVPNRGSVSRKRLFVFIAAPLCLAGCVVGALPLFKADNAPVNDQTAKTPMLKGKLTEAAKNLIATLTQSGFNNKSDASRLAELQFDYLPGDKTGSLSVLKERASQVASAMLAKVPGRIYAANGQSDVGGLKETLLDYFHRVKVGKKHLEIQQWLTGPKFGEPAGVIVKEKPGDNDDSQPMLSGKTAKNTSKPECAQHLQSYFKRGIQCAFGTGEMNPCLVLSKPATNTLFGVAETKDHQELVEGALLQRMRDGKRPALLNYYAQSVNAFVPKQDIDAELSRGNSPHGVADAWFVAQDLHDYVDLMAKQGITTVFSIGMDNVQNLAERKETMLHVAEKAFEFGAAIGGPIDDSLMQAAAGTRPGGIPRDALAINGGLSASGRDRQMLPLVGPRFMIASVALMHQYAKEKVPKSQREGRLREEVVDAMKPKQFTELMRKCELPIQVQGDPTLINAFTRFLRSGTEVNRGRFVPVSSGREVK